VLQKKQSRLQAFSNAFAGMRQLLQHEIHMRIHVIAAMLCLAVTWWLEISGWQFLLVLLCIVLVMVTEIVNTAIEKLCDMVQPEFDHRIKYIKDISSAAVLLSAIFALVCGSIIFLPALVNKYH
jgi:diacylglycerol kinase